jgi:hypothetical protein
MISTTPMGDTAQQLGYVPAISDGCAVADDGFAVIWFRGPTLTGKKVGPGNRATCANAVSRWLRARARPKRPDDEGSDSSMHYEVSRSDSSVGRRSQR